MIRAVIFDCFGVLAGDGWLPFKRKHFAQTPELFEQATDLNKQVDSGFLDYESFVHAVAEMSGVTDREARTEMESNPVDELLFEYIATELKPTYKVGMLSNAGANWLPKLFTQQQIDVFDAVSLSYETGVIKPAAQAYEHIAQQLGVEPGDCVFLDDQERFVTAAQDVGMQGIVFRDAEQAIADLRQLLAK